MPLHRLSALVLPVLAAVSAAVSWSAAAQAATIKVSPGANLNSVYQGAQPGDEILLAPGAYGSQSIEKDPDKPLGSAHVTFRAQGPVAMSGFFTRANDVEYIGFNVPNSQANVRAGRNVVLRNFAAAKPYIWGPTSSGPAGDTIANVTVVGGDFGPHASCGGGFQIKSDGQISSAGGVPSGVRIIGNTFHDFTVPASCPTAHLDCLHSFNGTNGLVISGNRFVRCQHFGMLINSASNVVIENNFISGGIAGFKLRGDNSPSIEVFNNVSIRNNSADYIMLGSAGSNTLNNVRIEGNATIDGIDCRSGVAFANNLSQSGRCPGDLPSVASIGFADPAGGDFHIQASSPAVDRLSAAPGSDYDGEARPQGPKHDIGADEVLQPEPGTGQGEVRQLRSTLLRAILKHVDRWLRVSRRGFVTVPVACRPVGARPAPRRCKGTVRLRRVSARRTEARGTHGGRAGAHGTHARRTKRRLLGRKRFTIPTRRVVRVRVRLRPKARAAVRRRRVRARLTVVVRHRGSPPLVSSKRVVLVRPR